jgi:hypothetical protein
MSGDNTSYRPWPVSRLRVQVTTLANSSAVVLQVTKIPMFLQKTTDTSACAHTSRHLSVSHATVRHMWSLNVSVFTCHMQLQSFARGAATRRVGHLFHIIADSSFQLPFKRSCIEQLGVNLRYSILQASKLPASIKTSALSLSGAVCCAMSALHNISQAHAAWHQVPHSKEITAVVRLRQL